MIIETNSPEETFALGQKLGEQAKAGQIYTLNGDLGVGKTVFTQGIARGSGQQSDIYHRTGIRRGTASVLSFRRIPYRRYRRDGRDRL